MINCMTFSLICQVSDLNLDAANYANYLTVFFQYRRQRRGLFLISDFRRDFNIVYVLLGISPASNCSWPTFRNPVSVPSSKGECTVCTQSVHPAFEDGTDTGFRNVGQLQFDAGEIPRRKYTRIILIFNNIFLLLR